MTAIVVPSIQTTERIPTHKATKLITGEEFFRMADTNWCELIEGRIVRYHPTGYAHGEYELNFATALRAFVRKHQLGRVMAGEVGIYVRRDPDSVRGADILYISHEQYAQMQSDSFMDVAPELVVEIMSPDDAWSMVMQKLRDYFNIGVQLIWVADPKARIVYAYRSVTDVREFTAADELPGDDILPGFAVPVAHLFEE